MKIKRQLPEPGEVYIIPYPFVRETVSLPDDEGGHEELSWRPGVRLVPRHDDADAVADGMGEQLIRVLATFKPPGFPLRVFYTRRWCGPGGKEFGKNRCRITTIHAFWSLVNGYRHEFEMAPDATRKAAR